MFICELCENERDDSTSIGPDPKTGAGNVCLACWDVFDLRFDSYKAWVSIEGYSKATGEYVDLGNEPIKLAEGPNLIALLEILARADPMDADSILHWISKLRRVE